MSEMSSPAPIPILPESAPFSPDQRAWLNGFLAGMLSVATESSSTGEVVQKASLGELLLMYGSQSGTCEGLSREIKETFAGMGFDVKMSSLNDYEKVGFLSSKSLLIITSTWGDGEPPDNATDFWEFISSESAPSLNELEYSVLALGDTNYAEFCGFGKNVDSRLAELGAKRIFDRVDCDVDYDDAASAWKAGVQLALENKFGDGKLTEKFSETQQNQSQSLDSNTINTVEYNRKNPFPAPYNGNYKLNAEGSKKDTRHVVFSIDGAGWTYECGDSLGVFPKNCPQMTQLLLDKLGIDGTQESQTPDGKSSTVFDRLLTEFNISKVSKKFINWAAKVGNYEELADVANDKEALKGFTQDRDIIDFLEKYPLTGISADDFFSQLGKLQARLYSIASSPRKYPNEIHLTVGVVTLEVDGRMRKGVCSTYMSDRIEDGESVPTFVQASKTFRLPENTDTPIIMVGPGTGIAPFLAFLQDREATDAKGKNWLFFGDQHQATDFLYSKELTAWKDSGLLSRLDLAFSRDQAEKIYVQDRMYENGAEFWDWIDAGACVYVCGDAKRMAVDVDNTLKKIINEFGKVPEDKVDDFVKQMKSEGRYLRDVY